MSAQAFVLGPCTVALARSDSSVVIMTLSNPGISVFGRSELEALRDACEFALRFGMPTPPTNTKEAP